MGVNLLLIVIMAIILYYLLKDNKCNNNEGFVDCNTDVDKKIPDGCPCYPEFGDSCRNGRDCNGFNMCE